MNGMIEEREAPDFKLPAPGEGSDNDYCDAGMSLGAEFARRWMSLIVAAATADVLDELEQDFLSKAIGDMQATAKKLRRMGYADERVAHFENGMILGYRRTISSMRNHKSERLN